MKTVKTLFLMVILLGGLTAGKAGAEGLYVLGSVGGKTVYDEDFSDFYSDYGYTYGYDAEGLAEGAVSLGYRFPGPLALEGSVTYTEGRSTSQALSYDYFGYPNSSDSLTVNPMTTFALGPVFCWDRRSWWFAESGLTEFGVKVNYASLSGSESYSDSSGNYGSQDFSGSNVGFGIFIRALNLWNPTGFTVGLEAGYDYQRFDSLTVSNESGVFADPSTNAFQNPYGSGAYIDNSGGYLRLVIGWSSGSSAPAYGDPGPRRRRFYRDDY
jgi:hypothetical protein